MPQPAPHSKPTLTRIHETILYGSDLAAMRAFYEGLGLRVVSTNPNRAVVFRINPDSVLIVFNPAETTKPHEVVPSHGSTGAGHAAFTVPPGELDAWRAHLQAQQIPIEKEVAWPIGGFSLYFRDPAGNSVEFIDGRVWPE